MQGIEATVHPDFDVFILPDVTVHSQAFQSLCQIGVVGRHHTAVSGTTQILRGKEAEAGDGPQHARSATLVLRADRLAGVFNDLQFVLLGNSPDGIHLTALSKQMNWHDGAGPRCNRFFDRLRIEIECLGIDIDEDRRRTRAADRAGGCEKRERCRDDFVSLSNPHGLQGDDQCICSRITADRVSRVAVVGNFPFQFGDFVPQNEFLFREDALHGGHDLCRHRVELRNQINKRDWSFISHREGVRHLRVLSHPASQWDSRAID